MFSIKVWIIFLCTRITIFMIFLPNFFLFFYIYSEIFLKYLIIPFNLNMSIILKNNPLFSRPEHNCSVKRAAIVGEGVKLVNHLPFLNCQRWWGGTRGTSSQTHLTQPSLALVGNTYKSCIRSLSTFNCLRFRIMEMSSTELSTLGKLNWTSLDLGVSPLNSVVMMIGPFWLQIRN